MERSDITDTWVTFDITTESSTILDVIDRALASGSFSASQADWLNQMRNGLHAMFTIISDGGVALNQCLAEGFCTTPGQVNTITTLSGILASLGPAAGPAAAAPAGGVVTFSGALPRKVILTQKNLHPGGGAGGAGAPPIFHPEHKHRK
jgi:hypothetical protein